MDLNDKVALITGASSGIGKTVTIKLVGLGMKVVGCGRRLEKLEQLAGELNNKGPGNMFSLKCDLIKEDEILKMFATIKQKYGALHVVVNNAGQALNENLLSGSTANWRCLLDINVMAPAIVARESFKLMQETKVAHGDILFINSTLGHKILENMDLADFYTITKHATTAMVKLFRKEINAIAPHIRCSSISPGSTKSEIFYDLIGKEVAEMMYTDMTTLCPSDIADSVVHILTAPPHLRINDLELEAIFNAPAEIK